MDSESFQFPERFRCLEIFTVSILSLSPDDGTLDPTELFE